METVLALLTGAMVAGSVFLMLSRNLVRFIFGLVLASNAVNLLIFAAGRMDTVRPPLIEQGALQPAATVANSLPQALILTAIVIGFALLAFIFILFLRAYQQLGTVDTEAMAESDSQDLAPAERSRL
ncbi:NADH-quinone oxidoreductase subunit K [Desulfosarcina sp.]|uniref:NADH-quinone oxidoreductase subunit K n=1 Tax=Desulfosarcina sp. TaxID=2027861 RepID=UPI003568B919